MALCIPAFLAFSLPALMPTVLAFAFGGSVVNGVIAVFCIAFYLLMVGVTYRFNLSLRQAQRVRFENEGLMNSLKEAYQKIFAQNHKLNMLPITMP